MSTYAPTRARQSFRHEAFLWRGRAEFVRGLVPFVREGIAADEAVMVAVIPEHTAWIREGIGSAARHVHFVDMMELGRNPARIIAAWQEFVEDRGGPDRPARGIGEPIWPGRQPEEIVECQLHEALLNVAVDPEVPFWLLCPYDALHLDAGVLVETGQSHPALATPSSYHGSPSYRGHARAKDMFMAELALLPGVPVEMAVTNNRTFDAAAEFVSLQAVSAGLWSNDITALVDALRRLTAGSLRRGAQRLSIRLWDQPDVLICDLIDDTVVEDLLFGRRAPLPGDDDALWLANMAFDLVQARSNDSGTTVRCHLLKERRS